METKPTLYYVHGVLTRGEEVIRLLEEKGGVNKYKYSGGLDEAIYYIDHENNIDRVYEYETNRYKFITHYGTELTLPDPVILKWEDIEDEWGTLLEGVRFPTDQQYDSVVAASKIAQVRHCGVETYGEIVPNNEPAYYVSDEDTPTVSACGWYYRGGLLRFLTMQQAELFIENNEQIVKTYLKTFS